MQCDIRKGDGCYSCRFDEKGETGPPEHRTDLSGLWARAPPNHHPSVDVIEMNMPYQSATFCPSFYSPETASDICLRS